MRGEAATLPRWAVLAVGAVCAIAVAYTFYRGAVVGLEYFDGHSYLFGTRRLAGDGRLSFSLVRPPLISLADVPAVAIANLGAPANRWYVVGPHVTVAILSVLSAAAVCYAFAASLGWRLALLGATFLVTGRLFVRYGSLTMADVVSMGWAALTLGLYARSLARPSWRLAVLCGVALGLGGATKYPLLMVGAVLVLAELLVSIKRRRVSAARVGGLAITAASSAVTFVAVLAVCQCLAFGWSQLGQLPAVIKQAIPTLTGALGPLPGETRWDHFVLVADTTAWPLLALAVLGLTLALRDRDERDLPFLAWLLGLGGILIASLGHNEARYLLPVIPALLYFAARAVEALLARAPRQAPPHLVPAAVVVLAIACSWGGVRQAWADADPVFHADAHRKAAAALVRLRRPGGKLAWIGGFSCLYPTRRYPLPRDEFFDSFQFFGPSMSYFVGEPAAVIPSLLSAADKDAVMIGGPNCDGTRLPATPAPPYTIHGVARRPLANTTGTFATTSKDLTLQVSKKPSGLALLVTRGFPRPGPDRQRYLVVADPAARLIGPLPLTPDSEVFLGARAPEAVKAVELLELTIETIKTR